MSATQYAVDIATSEEAWSKWLAAVPLADGENWNDARARHCEQLGRTVLHLSEGQFYWLCPHCGGAAGGDLGDEPVSGWDSPQWAASGPTNRLSLTPSLGCPTWRRGLCDGHWWLRDGQLVRA